MYFDYGAPPKHNTNMLVIQHYGRHKDLSLKRTIIDISENVFFVSDESRVFLIYFESVEV